MIQLRVNVDAVMVDISSSTMINKGELFDITPLVAEYAEVGRPVYIEGLTRASLNTAFEGDGASLGVTMAMIACSSLTEISDYLRTHDKIDRTTFYPPLEGNEVNMACSFVWDTDKDESALVIGFTHNLKRLDLIEEAYKGALA